MVTNDFADPALLISYAYFDERQKRMSAHFRRIRRWVLDSGAFTAFTKGSPIRLVDYIDRCHELLESDDPPAAIFALDVIYDWKATRRNVREMWAAGIEAIPTYHVGSPERWLMECAREYPKMAVGGVARLRGKKKVYYTKQLFARVWPARVHGFACFSIDLLDAAPWHSVDATSWNNPGRWGACRSLSSPSRGYPTRRIRGVDVRMEIDFYMRQERKFRSRWRGAMAELDRELGEYNVPQEIYFAV